MLPLSLESATEPTQTFDILWNLCADIGHGIIEISLVMRACGIDDLAEDIEKIGRQIADGQYVSLHIDLLAKTLSSVK